MNPKQIGIGILVLAVIGIAVMQFGNTTTKTSTQAPTAVIITQPATTTAPAEGTAMMADAKYKDGEYTATGMYTSPAMEEEVDIALTLDEGVVVAAEFTGKATNAVSQKLQKQFSEGYTEQVVGKKIDEINLTVVNGASLTPKGFMNALEKVKAEAAQS